MPSRSLLVGSRLPDLERTAFECVADAGDTTPARVLYLTRSGHPTEQSERRWRSFGTPLGLRTQSLDNFVADCYERDRYAGPETHVSRTLLLRLVELGIERLPDDNPFSVAGEIRSSGFTRASEDLFTDLEFAGLLDADAIHDALAGVGLDERADTVAALARAILDVREETLAEELAETFQTERIAHVASATDLADQFPSVESVIIGPLDQYGESYVELLAAITETWPTIALCPRHTDTPIDAVPPGVDRSLERALSVYGRLGFEQERVGSMTAGASLAASLYRHPETAPPVPSTDPETFGIDFHEATDVPAELRYVARDVRERVADGTDPEEIGVIVPPGTDYGDRLDELFAQYDVSHHRRADRPLTETHHGDLVDGLCELANEPRRAETVLAALTNPLVHGGDDAAEGTESGLPDVDHAEFARTADRVEATNLETVLSHVESATADGARELLDRAEHLADTPLDTLPEALDETLTSLGVGRLAEDDERGAADRATTTHLGVDRDRERRARGAVGEITESLRVTAAAADESLGTTTERLSRALDGVSIPDVVGERSGSVRVRQLGDADAFEFSYTYLLGLTTDHLPSPRERTTLVEPIYDRYPDLVEGDPSIEARSHLVGHLAGTGDVLLSVPQRDVSGERLVEADFLTELRRSLNLGDAAIDPEAPRPGTVEDVHHEIGRAVASDPDRADAVAAGVDGRTSGERVDSSDDIVNEAVETGVLSPAYADRLRAGIACANARSDDALTPYDGRLTTETVSLVHSATEREPYSPSRVEQYAACGFQYYADNVLEIETPDRIERDPDAAARGTYIHDVLEAYYRSLQSTRGEPVDPSGDREQRADRLLTIALDQLDDTFDDETQFQTAWLRQVLAGLGTPEQNPYYDPRDSETATGVSRADENEPEPPRGLFARFLAVEDERVGKTTARPTWFEARVGRPGDDGTHLADDPVTIETPNGSVPLGGVVDRIDTVENDPTGLVVRDYKTGSAPSETDSLGGLAFQLPLYAKLAEGALDDVETLGGVYHRVSPPTTVSPHSGLITSQEYAAYYGSDDPRTPLLRNQYPHFETHAAFRRFVDETVPARLGELTEGIEEGRFHPTVLDPDDAGCEYCDYRSVCDVRSHHRQEVIDRVADGRETAYVPPLARDTDLVDVVEVE